MKWFFQILAIGRNASPELKVLIHGMIDNIEEQSRKTPGTADDQAAQVLKAAAMLLGLY